MCRATFPLRAPLDAPPSSLMLFLWEARLENCSVMGMARHRDICRECGAQTARWTTTQRAHSSNCTRDSARNPLTPDDELKLTDRERQSDGTPRGTRHPTRARVQSTREQSSPFAVSCARRSTSGGVGQVASPQHGPDDCRLLKPVVGGRV